MGYLLAKQSFISFLLNYTFLFVYNHLFAHSYVVSIILSNTSNLHS